MLLFFKVQIKYFGFAFFIKQEQFFIILEFSNSANFLLLMEKKYHLEDRLVRLAGETIKFCNSLGNSFADNHLKNQLIRSSTGACLNYGEAQGAESKKDFIHKSGIVLK